MELFQPDDIGDERTLLTQFLDYHRSVLVRKAEGLTQAQLAVRVPPSTLTLAGLVKHMAYVEDGWFQEDLLGRELPEPWRSAPFADDRDWEFHSAPDDDPAELLALYRAACDRSRAAVAEFDSLDAVARGTTRPGVTFNLRWILVHMVEETARHNGHADLLRESIDGTTGD